MGELYFNVEVGNDYFRNQNVVNRNMLRAEAVGTAENGNKKIKTYRLPAQEGESFLEVAVVEESVTPLVSRLHTEVTCRGTEPVSVNGVSSLYYRNLAVDGRWWCDKDRMSVWVCRNAWCGEGQWVECSLSDLGLFPGTMGVAQVGSYGTWQTCRNYPLVILCDKKNNRSYCFETEATAGRYLEIGALGNNLYVYVTSANENTTGWSRTMTDGDTYESQTAAFAVVEGGFEEAVSAMIEYKRATSLVKWEAGYAPACFNDYMNCLWARPTREKLLPLISAAAEAGMEIFCIDAGWFGNWHDPNVGMCGHWVPDDTPFGEQGLQGIIDEIRASGMRAGLWLELECVLAGAPFFRAHPEYLLTRRGVKIHRDFPDFRIPAVREYFTKQIDDLCAMGVSYFKNDYNANLEAGCDSIRGGTLQDGAREYDEAFLAFIDETLARHPGLIIENCGSGAMRSDNLHLSHFALQSITDHMDYENMPSIIQGSLAQMPPEKAGIWAYPYPLRNPNAVKDGVTLKDVVPTEDSRTVSNLAGGLFGCLYLSGHIELADEAGKARLKEAVDFYKSVRTWTCNALPIYPDKMLQMLDPGVAVFGLLNKEAKKMLLGVFGSILPEETVKTLDLSKYCGASARVCRVFTDGEVKYTADLPSVTVTLPAGTHALVLELDL